jgi:hypothetical protein
MKTTFVLFNIKHTLYLTLGNEGGYHLTPDWNDCIQFTSVECAEYELINNATELRRYNLKDWEIKKYYIL